MVVSRLKVENRASIFAVPELAITQREILYESPVYFTPLLDESHVNGEKIRKIVEEEYRKAGISRAQVDTGAIIITGETSRKENARILCIDRVRALPDTYLDIGAPVGGAFPVVLKTLVLERSRT